MIKSIFRIKNFFLLAGFLLFTLVTVRADSNAELKILTADQMAPLALKDSMYYHYDEWFIRFQGEIDRLKSAPPSLENQVELMKFHFNYAGLLGELCHTLAFTSKYQDDKITGSFLYHSLEVKSLAYKILDNVFITSDQEAQANFFLGASEGYIGIFEYGKGNLIEALVNGFHADTHLERALLLDPKLVDVHFGLGLYRYGNSRLGGMGNLIMQGGKDYRLVGLNHIEQSILNGAVSQPLALKTLAWFYISEQINPENKGLPHEDPLSQKMTRKNALALLIDIENQYFKKPSPYPHFKGNKELAIMKAFQSVLDKDYANAGIEFKKSLKIIDHLKNRGFLINPQLVRSVEAAIKFCKLMLLQASTEPEKQLACVKVNKQIKFIEGGGSMVEYDSKKIRRELHLVFAEALNQMTKKLNCNHE